MRKYIKHSFVVAAAIMMAVLSSCTKVICYDEPQINDYGITIVNASMDSIRINGLEGLGIYKWASDDTIGIYGSEKGENVCYTPFDTTRFCGELVKGELTLYYPYLPEGSKAVSEWRLPLRYAVNYAATAEDFIYNNMTFVCRGLPSDFHFTFHTGLLKFELAIESENISAMTLKLYDSDGKALTLAGNMSLDGRDPLFTDPADALRIENVGGGTATEEKPLTLFVALPQADCATFDVIVESTSGESSSYHSKTGFSIRNKCLTSFTIKEIKPWWGLDGWKSEDGGYIKEGN